MKKLISLLTFVILVLAGCGAATDTSSEAETNPCETGESKIGMVTDTGGINDKSFNQGTWEGIQDYCAETGVGATYIQSTDSSQYATNIETLAQSNEVVVAAGYYFETAIYDAAIAYPDVDFIIIDAEPVNSATGEVATLDNVQSFLFEEQEAGYLVGYIAAKTSTTGHIGFIGGNPVPAVQKFGYGYIAGAQAANPEVIVEYGYANTFSDSNTTKTMAESQIALGVDVIFTAAGGANNGVVEATKTATLENPDAPVWAIGVDRDMYDDGLYTDANGEEKSVILTSAVKHVGAAAYSGITDHFNGTFEGGVSVLGYEDGGAGLPETNPNVDDALINEAVEAFESEESVPTTADEVNAMLTTATVNGNL